MEERAMPGLPDDAKSRREALEAQIALADARRYIGETLLKSKELEAIGNKTEIKKLVAWVKAVVDKAPGAALEAQTRELDRLRRYAES